MTVIDGASRKGKPYSEAIRLRALQGLSLFGTLSQPEAALFCAVPLSTAKYNLRGLKADRLIETVRRARQGGAGRPLVRWHLTEAGYGYALDGLGESRLGPWRANDGETVFSNSPKHKKGCMRSMIAAFLAAEQLEAIKITRLWSSFRPNEAPTLRKGPGARRRETTIITEHEGREVRLSSDGAFLTMRLSGQEHLFNVEYDGGSEGIAARPGVEGLNQETIGGKIRLYWHLMQTGELGAHFGHSLSYVLFLAENEDRARKMAHALDWSILAPINDIRAEQLFRFTTLERAEEGGFFGRIWTAPNRAEPVALGGAS